MTSYQLIRIAGRLTHDPEHQRSPAGTAWTTFSVAVNRSFTTRTGEPRRDTAFFIVQTWGDLADRCASQLQRGQFVFVAGSMQTRSWDDAQGASFYVSELHAELVLPGEHRGSGNHNDWLLLGTLTDDPLPATTNTGIPVTTFRVAVQRRARAAGSAPAAIDLIPIQTWNGRAEACAAYLSAGRSVLVHGRARTRRWRDYAGYEQVRIELTANSVLFLDAPPARPGSNRDPGPLAPPARTAPRSARLPVAMNGQAP